MYRLLVICHLILFSSATTYAQIKKQLQPELNYTSVTVSNATGGDKRAVQMMGLLEIGITLSSDSAQLWKGGSFNLETISTHGKGIAATMHDRQGLVNIEAHNNPLILWELWYHQQFGKFGIRGGLQNINSHFMNQPYSANFTNSSYGAFPTLALNYSLPNYPVSGLGITSSYQINNKLNLFSSLYNGKVSNLKTDRMNTHWKANVKEDGIFSISELKYATESTSTPSSIFGLGATFHNKSFASVKNDGKNYTNNYVFYAYGQHQLYKTASKNAGVFLQGSWTGKDRNITYGYTSVGLVANGFFTKSHTDNAGIGLAQLYYQRIENNEVKNEVESILEAYLMLQINKRVSIKPSLFTIFSTGKPCIAGGLFYFHISIF